MLELRCRGAQSLYHVADRFLEDVDARFDMLRALGLLPLLTLLFFTQAASFDGSILEDLDGLGHGADLIAAVRAGNFGIGVASGQSFHRLGHGTDGPNDRASGNERKGTADQDQCGNDGQSREEKIIEAVDPDLE